ESSVIKGKVVAIEKDMAVIDVGLKTEGRVALREFAGPGRESERKVGDEAEVSLDRIENALGEAALSRDKARSDERWRRLETAWSRTSPITVRSLSAAASTACFTSPISPGDGSITRPRCSRSARP